MGLLPKLGYGYAFEGLKALIIFGVFMLYNYLTKDIKDNFHFELTPEKRCDNGSYMWSSNPEKAALCSKFSKEQLARYECPGGLYNGRPIWRQGAGNIPLSDDNWQNTTCKQIGDNLPDPQVLKIFLYYIYNIKNLNFNMRPCFTFFNRMYLIV
jgi:hypothetical protein